MTEEWKIIWSRQTGAPLATSLPKFCDGLTGRLRHGLRLERVSLSGCWGRLLSGQMTRHPLERRGGWRAAPSLMGQSTYAQKLQDAAFWQPYVDQVLRRHHLPWETASVGAIGTFPTFLVGSLVVKFFGQRFDGAECFDIERSLYTQSLPMLRAVGVPRLVAHGHLFETGWSWPYIVTTRLAGTAWRQIACTSAGWKAFVAGELGAALREVHQLHCPDEPVWHRDVLGALRATSAAGHRRRRMLPEFLIQQIDEYLAPTSAECRLVHADLHGDHIFIRDGHLAGIIDWGCPVR
jgi:hygromycin-B 7''-O-kinase